MKVVRVVMEIVVDVSDELHEQATRVLLLSLQEQINNAVLSWKRPTFVLRDEIRIRTTGWS